MRRMFTVVLAVFFALSFLSVAFAGNYMWGGGPLVSPKIVNDDYFSPTIGIFQKGTFGETGTAVSSISPAVSPLIARDDNLAPAFSGAVKSGGSFAGEVVAINKHADTLTLSALGPSVSPSLVRDDSMMQYASEGGFSSSTVLACNMNTDFHHIKVGDQVNIRYQERGGMYIAKLADSSAPIIACNLQ